MSKPNRDLVEQIEQLVREHIEATRRATAVAVERAFVSGAANPRASTHTKASDAPKRASGARRSRAELAALAERLHEAVCSHPGETITLLAPRLDASSRELEGPMRALKRAGRVRSVGQRHLTRYFPTVTGTVAAAS